MAKEMGRLDIGQSVAVKDRGPGRRGRRRNRRVHPPRRPAVRAGLHRGQGGQAAAGHAFDVPTIGLGTLETMAASGGQVLAVEAGRTIIIDQPEVIDFADRHGLVIVAVEAGQVPEPTEEAA